MINKVVITDNTERAAVIDVILDFSLWHNSIVGTSDFGEVFTVVVEFIIRNIASPQSKLKLLFLQ